MDSMKVWDDIDDDLNKVERDGLYRRINELTAAVSTVKFQRDVFWPLAFCAGLLIGWVLDYVGK